MAPCPRSKPCRVSCRVSRDGFPVNRREALESLARDTNPVYNVRRDITDGPVWHSKIFFLFEFRVLKTFYTLSSGDDTGLKTNASDAPVIVQKEDINSCLGVATKTVVQRKFYEFCYRAVPYIVVEATWDIDVQFIDPLPGM